VHNFDSNLPDGEYSFRRALRNFSLTSLSGTVARCPPKDLHFFVAASASKRSLNKTKRESWFAKTSRADETTKYLLLGNKKKFLLVFHSRVVVNLSLKHFLYVSITLLPFTV